MWFGNLLDVSNEASDEGAHRTRDLSLEPDRMRSLEPDRRAETPLKAAALTVPATFVSPRAAPGGTTAPGGTAAPGGAAAQGGTAAPGATAGRCGTAASGGTAAPGVTAALGGAAGPAAQGKTPTSVQTSFVPATFVRAVLPRRDVVSL
eukprot:gnl/TRDRNA2_/TRDRNA2_100559_c0_seq1.p2 gnl/TRDRNA2_/TRDRNA2_100559_c0~~gnl/TRDRNA2_/TRDRNA2_100559_c0_seq1.p2  ORF type:complete len:149 (-),score=15.49 gnl/TRDRNA2_/TRDRNA2_100559_c0_seq1:133-579(-)